MMATVADAVGAVDTPRGELVAALAPVGAVSAAAASADALMTGGTGAGAATEGSGRRSERRRARPPSTLPTTKSAANTLAMAQTRRRPCNDAPFEPHDVFVTTTPVGAGRASATTTGRTDDEARWKGGPLPSTRATRDAISYADGEVPKGNRAAASSATFG